MIFRYFLPGLFYLVAIQWCDVAAQTRSHSLSHVILNDRALTKQDIDGIRQLYGIDPIPGEYWYDAQSGMFGLSDGPAMGVMFPNHDFGKLRSDASGGTSRVYINGRELQIEEAARLAKLLGYDSHLQGRYWLAANGNFGIEGHPLTLGNVYVALSQVSQHGRQAGDNFWSRAQYSAGNHYLGANGQPNQGYVSVPGYGPVSHGMH